MDRYSDIQDKLKVNRLEEKQESQHYQWEDNKLNISMDNANFAPEDETQEQNKKEKAHANIEEALQSNLPKDYADDIKISRETFKRAADSLARSSFGQFDEHYHWVQDSREMMGVKDSLASLNRLYLRPIDVSTTQPFDILSNFRDNYNNVISHSNIYLTARPNPKSKEGKKRKRYVQELKTSLEHEQGQLELAVQKGYRAALDADAAEQAQLTYADILRFCRTQTIRLKKDKAEGGNNSSVYYLEGDSKLFKQCETTFEINMRNARSEVDTISKKIVEPNEAGQVDPHADIMQEFAKEIFALVDYFSADIKLKDKDLAFDIMALVASASYKEFIKAFHRFKSQVKESIKDRDAKNEFINTVDEIRDRYIFGDVHKQDGTVERVQGRDKLFREALEKKYFSRLNCTLVANYNGIGPNTNVTYRNVGMSRMCKALGFNQGIVAKSELARVEVEDKHMEGVLMENADGMSLAKLGDLKKTKKIQDKDCGITEEAAQQIIQLQILDMICGQCDRHGNNVFVLYDKEAYKKDHKIIITKVTGIDNDMAFGNLEENQSRYGFNCMSSLCSIKKVNNVDVVQFAFKHMDEEIYHNIMALSDEYIEFMLADLQFTEKEMTSLKNRVHDFQRALFNTVKSNKNFLIKNKDGLKNQNNLTEIYEATNANSESLVDRFKREVSGKIQH